MFKKCTSILLVSLGVLLFASNSYAILIAGSSSGIFTSPSGSSWMVVGGVGTDYFTWGDAGFWGTGPNSLDFEGNTFSVEHDEVFSFGTLTYFNGTTAIGSEAESVNLEVTLSLSTPSGIEEDFSYNLGLINTPNTASPIQSADYVIFPSLIPDNYFTVDGINYTLDFVGFGNITGSGFTTIDSLYVLEGYTASVELLGRFTVATPVPEPSSILLVGSGLFGLVMYRHRKNKALN